MLKDRGVVDVDEGVDRRHILQATQFREIFRTVYIALRADVDRGRLGASDASRLFDSQRLCEKVVGSAKIDILDASDEPEHLRALGTHIVSTRWERGSVRIVSGGPWRDDRWVDGVLKRNELRIGSSAVVHVGIWNEIPVVDHVFDSANPEVIFILGAYEDRGTRR
jgi:hypothetical protein